MEKELKTNIIPYGKQTISEADINSVVKVLRSPYLTQGPVVPAFEVAIAEKVGASFGVAVNSATSALHIACLALGVKSGDIVWTSPISFVASANCAYYCNAIVDFVDIELKTGLMSITALRRKLEIAETQNKLPKVIVPVHLAGSSCDMQQIAKLSAQYGFRIIEDASHAIGGKYLGQYVGCCAYSDITVFSFHPVKIITSAEGGIAVTNNSDLANTMRSLSSHGIIKEPSSFINQEPTPWWYEQQMLGFNYRMSDLHAALGISQLERIDEFVSRRNILYQRYLSLMTDLPLSMLAIPNNTYSSLHLAVIQIHHTNQKSQQLIYEYLREKNVGSQLHYIPIYQQPYYKDLNTNYEDKYPNAEAYQRISLSIPLYPSLTYAQQDYVVQILSKAIHHLN